MNEDYQCTVLIISFLPLLVVVIDKAVCTFNDD